jgi:hypothetical protein
MTQVEITKGIARTSSDVRRELKVLACTLRLLRA